jgi:4-hydroxybenzoate polyprenyltransferase
LGLCPTHRYRNGENNPAVKGIGVLCRREILPDGDRVLDRLKITLEMIKIEHTIFALPFAFMGAFLAARGLPGLAQCGWISLAMVGARSAAMAFNRLVDERFDAQNPRTENRALPRKLVARSFVVFFMVLTCSILMFAASMLNNLSFKLSPVALVIVFFYSYTKRFTWLSHLFLGISLACAPIGAWIAIRGHIAPAPLILGLAVALWVAGFDVIYACQDIDFDRRAALYSIPQRFGLAGALWISGALHLMMVGLLILLFLEERLGGLSGAGLVMVTALLAYQHSLVKPTDMSRANTAFFTLNGWISILLFVTTSADLIWCRPL